MPETLDEWRARGGWAGWQAPVKVNPKALSNGSTYALIEAVDRCASDSTATGRAAGSEVAHAFTLRGYPRSGCMAWNARRRSASAAIRSRMSSSSMNVSHRGWPVAAAMASTSCSSRSVTRAALPHLVRDADQEILHLNPRLRPGGVGAREARPSLVEARAGAAACSRHVRARTLDPTAPPGGRPSRCRASPRRFARRRCRSPSPGTARRALL
jgi:hypothetical protein